MLITGGTIVTATDSYKADVLIDGEKVAAIGIKLNRSVVSHGFALNLTTDLDYFDGIVPCGHPDKRPTSVEALAGVRLNTQDAARDYARHFADVFEARAEWGTLESVLASGRA